MHAPLRHRTRAWMGSDSSVTQDRTNNQTGSISFGGDEESKIASINFTTKIVRKAQRQWCSMSWWSRLCCSVALTLVVVRTIYGTLDSSFQYYGTGRTKGAKANTAPSSFAVVINTFKRPTILRETVTHYADTCGPEYGVGQVFIVWSEKGTPPPSSSFGSRTRGNAKNRNGAPVTVLNVDKDSLNSRYLPIDSLKGQAVFMVDDDIRVACSSLLRGFEAWQTSPDAMVGYYPRLAAPPRNNYSDSGGSSLVYYSWPTVFFRQKFNVILTKAAFLHERYLRLYSTEDHPQEIRDYIDNSTNCEDLAMAMLVANVTKGSSETPAFPIYVEGTVSDKGLFSGISTGGGMGVGHFVTRSSCLTDLTQIYEDRGWGAPLSKATSLRDSSWVHHFPGFWWQYKPSNMFEWFALQNFFE